jgi:ribokinase
MNNPPCGRVVVIGSCNVDFTFYLARFPAPGETVIAQRSETAFGGKGANQAVAAARAGASVLMGGAVGDDDLGAQVFEHLKTEGMQLALAKRPGSTGQASIWVDATGQNAIVVDPGANATVDLPIVRMIADLIMPRSVLLLQQEIPTLANHNAAAVLRERVDKIIFNPAPLECNAEFESVLRNTDYLIVNQGELEGLLEYFDIETAYESITSPGFPLAVRQVLEHGPKAVIVTLGAQGVFHITEDRFGYMVGHKVNAIDTVGAGDCFCGYFAALISGGNSLDTALELANKAAALSVTQCGAQPSFPDMSEVEAWSPQR